MCVWTLTHVLLNNPHVNGTIKNKSKYFELKNNKKYDIVGMLNIVIAGHREKCTVLNTHI